MRGRGGAYVVDAAGLISPGAEDAAEARTNAGFGIANAGGRWQGAIIGPEVVTVVAGIKGVEVRADLGCEGDFLELASFPAGE